jgi:hypothetical protein
MGSVSDREHGAVAEGWAHHWFTPIELAEWSEDHWPKRKAELVGSFSYCFSYRGRSRRTT